MKKILFIGSLLLSSSIFGQFDPSERSTSQKFDEVMDNVTRFYVDPVKGKELTETAIIAMLEKLDPHSTYIPAEELSEAQSSINGSFVGVGIRFQIMKVMTR